MRKINKQICAEIIVFLSFVMYIIYMILTKKYLRFVNPRLLPYLILTIGLFTIWGVNRLKYLYRPMYKNQYSHLYLMVIVFAVFISPLNDIQVSTLPKEYEPISTLYVANFVESKKLVQLKDLLADENEAPIDENQKKETVSNEQISEIINDANRMSAQFIKNGLDINNLTITIEDAHYMSWIYELTDYAHLYKGFKIKLKGFVYNNSGLDNNNSFLISRLLISCCVADLTPVGMIAVYDSLSTKMNNQWYEFEGVLDYANYNGKVVPVIRVNNEQKINKPVVEYVYP